MEVALGLLVAACDKAEHSGKETVSVTRIDAMSLLIMTRLTNRNPTELISVEEALTLL
jgi:hypothetical protein